MNDLRSLKKQFLEYLEIEKGRGIKTAENYNRYLDRFFKFLGTSNSPEKITEDSVRKYRLNLNRINLSKKTQNYHIIALRSFLKFLSKKGVKSLDAEKLELAKLPERELDLIGADELGRLLNSPDSPLNKAILETLFSSGLRVSEL